jgi:hypothetical protein
MFLARARHSWIARMAPLALGVALMGGSCPEEAEQEPEVAIMRLAVGGQTVDVADDGTVTGGPITLNGTETITATFLKADGTAETLVTADEFELQVTPSSAALTFTRTSAFAGSLTAVTAGSAQIEVALFHLVEQHEDFGPFNVPVTVQ